MAVIKEMPKLSDTMTVGTVVKWHKQVGDQVANGDVLAEVESDKATMELENFHCLLKEWVHGLKAWVICIQKLLPVWLQLEKF